MFRLSRGGVDGRKRQLRLPRLVGEKLSDRLATKPSQGHAVLFGQPLEALELLGSASPEGWKERPDKLPASLESIDPAAAQALTELCLTVFNLNEFLFVD